jgi:hypothetical protein
MISTNIYACQCQPMLQIRGVVHSYTDIASLQVYEMHLFLHVKIH